MPSARASIGLWKWHALPSTTMAPSVGGKFPAISFTMVDLPAPLSPISPITSPASIEKLTSFSARMAPKLFETLRTSSKATRSLHRAGQLYPAASNPLTQLILHKLKSCDTYFTHRRELLTSRLIRKAWKSGVVGDHVQLAWCDAILSFNPID